MGLVSTHTKAGVQAGLRGAGGAVREAGFTRKGGRKGKPPHTDSTVTLTMETHTFYHSVSEAEMLLFLFRLLQVFFCLFMYVLWSMYVLQKC